MPDVKDRKILRELDIDARRPNSEIARKVGLGKEVVRYRIEKLMESGLIVKFQTTINYFKIGISKYKIYLRLKNADKKKLDEIGEYLYQHKKTEWVVFSTGKWDVIASFYMNNINEFDDEVQEIFERFAPYITDKAVTTTVYLAHHRREFLHPKTGEKIPPMIYYTSREKQEKITDSDREILKMLANNARMPVVEIAERLKMTARTVDYRIRDLEKRGIILGYRAHLEPKVIGRTLCKAIIYLSSTKKENIDRFINYVVSIPGAVWPQRVIGTWDIELDFELEGYDKFQEILFDLKQKFPELIKDYDFCLVSKEFKLDFFPDCYPIYR
ncbi:MAG: Lrp/AsnC family transcriptional regulator [Candidatus Micrarchaeota archaeon]|nr:Lrp/AsnC family transcriptional regulator [Candidatus Micrarchaeota archaeon]